MENSILTESEIEDFIKNIMITEGNLCLFQKAKEVSELDWATLLWESIQDWIDTDKKINPSRWNNTHKLWR